MIKGIKKWIALYIQSHSIKTILISFILIFTLIPSGIIFGLSYIYYCSVLKTDYSEKYISSVYAQCENNLTSVLNYLNMVMLNISTQNDLYSAILDSSMQRAEKTSVVTRELENLLKNTNIISGIEIITNDSIHYSYFAAPIYHEEHPDSFLNKISASSFTIDSRCATLDDQQYLIIGKKLFNYYNSYDIGYLILYINEDVLYSTYKDTIINNSTFFILVDDYIISHSDKSKIGTRLFIPDEILMYLGADNSFRNKYSMNLYEIDKTFLNCNMKIVSILPYDAIERDIAKLNTYIMLVLLLGISISLIISIILAKKLTKNISNLKNCIQHYDDYLTSQSISSRKNEISALEYGFEQMMQRIKNLIDNNNDAKEKQRIAELSALQAQINPHFLYNALDIISWTAKLKKQDSIEQIAYALSSFFRISLHKGENAIRVSEEIEHVKSYLFIENIRFPDLFQVTFDISDEILDYFMIKIILQPLVENAIKHGFKKLKRKGVITIKGYLTEDGDMEFKVMDNGAGMDFDPLTVAPIHHRFQGGYGIHNVHERLGLAYGKGYGLSYESQPDKGTTVTVRIKSTIDNP